MGAGVSAAHAAELELDAATHRIGLGDSPMRRHRNGYEYDYRDSPRRNRDETPPRRRDGGGQDVDEAWRQPSRLERALASPVESRQPASPPAIFRRQLSAGSDASESRTRRPPTSRLEAAVRDFEDDEAHMETQRSRASNASSNAPRSSSGNGGANSGRRGNSGHGGNSSIGGGTGGRRRGPYDSDNVNVVVREREQRAVRAQEVSAARGKQLFKLSLLEGADEELLGEDQTCPVCLEPMDDPVITNCKHIFCKNCIVNVMSSEQTEDLGSSAAPCPICREVADLPELKLARRASDMSYGARRPSTDTADAEAAASAVAASVNATSAASAAVAAARAEVSITSGGDGGGGGGGGGGSSGGGVRGDGGESVQGARLRSLLLSGGGVGAAGRVEGGNPTAEFGRSRFLSTLSGEK